MTFHYSGRSSRGGGGAFNSKPAPSYFVLLSSGVLVAFIPLLVLLSTESTSPRPSWPMALLVTCFAGGRLAWIASSQTRHLFEMAVWLFNYVFLGLAPLYQLRAATDPSTTPALDHRFDELALLVILVYQFALVAGSAVAGARVVRIRGWARVVELNRTNFWSTFFLVAALVYISAVGLSTLFTPRLQRGDEAASLFGGDPLVSLLVTGFVQFGVLVTVVAQVLLRRQGRGGSRVLIFSGLAVLVVLVNPIGSARFIIGTVWLAVAIAAGLFSTIRRYRWGVLLATIGLILVFPILDSFRYVVGEVESVNGFQSLAEADYDAYGQLLNTLEYTTVVGFSWGTQLLGVLLFWVPRSFWPSKPVDTGILLADFKGYSFSNLSAPVPAELYVNFGFVGVILFSFAIGYAFRRLDQSAEVSYRSTGSPTLLSAVLAIYMVFLFRGSLLQATSNLAVVLVVWLLVTRRGSPGALGGSRDSRARHPLSR